MIRSYQYLESVHQKLHEFVIAFFNRIEFETGDFDEAFFEPDFFKIVKRHPTLLKKRFQGIYNVIKTWNQADRREFCQQMRDSNEIDEICKGNVIPIDTDNLPNDIKGDLKKLFIDLYEKVLCPADKPFSEKYGSILDHFRKFKDKNKNLLCPACGLKKVQTQYDDTRDQYDHYLPKSVYPLSSVNFKNLVPICEKCNSKQIKGDKDVIKETTGKLFYPYDEDYSGLNVQVEVEEIAANLEDIKWKFTFSNEENKLDEIDSWKYIYNIDSRYQNHVRGSIVAWYSSYLEVQRITGGLKHEKYLAFLEADESAGLDYVRKPAFEAFLKYDALADAAIEAKNYS